MFGMVLPFCYLCTWVGLKARTCLATIESPSDRTGLHQAQQGALCLLLRERCAPAPADQPAWEKQWKVRFYRYFRP